MDRIEELLSLFQEISENPREQMDEYLMEGKKIIGCFPYYVPEEIIAAAGMVPFGLWGKHGTPKAAKEYFASFYCSIAQMGLEMVLDGTLEGISGILCTTLCDTLRPLTQNLKTVCKVPFIFLAHPQNRKPEYGITFTRRQYENVKKQIETIAGKAITEEDLWGAIRIYNDNRKALRRFVELAGKYPREISAVCRGAVLKSRHFMKKEEHTALLTELNGLLENLPEEKWTGAKVLTSGIILDNPKLLKLFDEQKLVIVADDVAHESRAIRKDVRESGDAMDALARHFASQDEDTILYDAKWHKRSSYIVDKVRSSGAVGVVISMMTFCDPEEIEYPSLKKALEEEGIPYIMLGYDHQIEDFGQAATSLQAFADIAVP